jgi:hypothetical protein
MDEADIYLKSLLQTPSHRITLIEGVEPELCEKTSWFLYFVKIAAAAVYP